MPKAILLVCVWHDVNATSKREMGTTIRKGTFFKACQNDSFEHHVSYLWLWVIKVVEWKTFLQCLFSFSFDFFYSIHSVLSVWNHIKEQCQRFASEFYWEVDFIMNLPIDITRLLFAIGFSLKIKPINKNGTWTVIEIAKHWSESFPNCLVRCIFLVIMWKEFSRIFVSGLWVKLSGLFRCNLFYWATQIDAKFREVFKSKHMNLALWQ